MQLRSLEDAFDPQTMSLGPRGNVRVRTVHVYGMSNVVYVCYNTCTYIPLCGYNDFLIFLGMVRPMQLDGICDKRHLAEYALGVRSVREAHTNHLLWGCLQRVVCHGGDGAERDG